MRASMSAKRIVQLCAFATAITFHNRQAELEVRGSLFSTQCSRVAGHFTLTASFPQPASAPGPWHNRFPLTPPRWDRVGPSPCLPREAMPRVSVRVFQGGVSV